MIRTYIMLLKCFSTPPGLRIQPPLAAKPCQLSGDLVIPQTVMSRGNVFIERGFETAIYQVR
jgi:hypothetical protein